MKTKYTIIALAFAMGTLARADKPQEAPAAESTAEPAESSAADKPLDDTAKKGLAWLVDTQNDDGGWGQGGGWRTNTEQGGRVEGANVADPSDIGNTAIALQAFLRAGAKLDQGEYSDVTRRAAKFVLDQVDKCDTDSLYVTDVRDTQLQTKIGRYVDTFLAVQILSDLKGMFSDPAEEQRRAKLLQKVIAKIETHQGEDGAFAGNSGWASTLSQGLCSKALNSAFQAGAKVDLATLEKDHRQNAEGLDRTSGVVAAASKPAAGDAGVEIYRYASKLGGMNFFSQTNSTRKRELNETVQSGTAAPDQKAQAKEELKKIEQADADHEVLLDEVAGRVKEDNFVAGFGNNGGEEFISFMNIGEALRAKGGKDWHDWNGEMTKVITQAQQADGSWVGQHCITGRSFCTASALMVMMTERVPQPQQPVAVKEDQGDR